MVGRYILALPSDEELQVFEKKINYSFTDYVLLREALQASSGFNGDGNKKLALIGDRILDLIIVTSGRNKNKTRSKRFIPVTSLYFTSWTYALIRRNQQYDPAEGQQCLSRQAGICPRH